MRTFYELEGVFGKYMGRRFNALAVSSPESIWDDFYGRENDDQLLVVKSVDIAVKILMLRGVNLHTLELYSIDGNLSV